MTPWLLAACGAAVAGLCLFAPQAAAAPPHKPATKAAGIEGTVTEVIDGDTVVLTPAVGAPLQVKLAGVDAPLICQPWGGEARDALKDWVLNHAVIVLPSSAGARNGSITGTLTLGADNINRRMVEEGHAWSQRVKWDQGPFVKQERVAHSLARGLFSLPHAMKPADWRRNNRPCS